jgi:SET domain
MAELKAAMINAIDKYEEISSQILKMNVAYTHKLRSNKPKYDANFNVALRCHSIPLHHPPEVKSTHVITSTANMNLKIEGVFWQFAQGHQKVGYRRGSPFIGNGILLFILHKLSKQYNAKQISTLLGIKPKGIHKVLYTYFSNGKCFNKSRSAILSAGKGTFTDASSFDKYFCNICCMFNCSAHLIMYRRINKNTLLVKLSLNEFPPKRVYLQYFRENDNELIDEAFVKRSEKMKCEQCINSMESFQRLNENEYALFKHYAMFFCFSNSCFYNDLLGIGKCSAINGCIQSLAPTIEQELVANTISINYKPLLNHIIKKVTSTRELHIPCTHQNKCSEACCNCVKTFGYCESFCKCNEYCNYKSKGCKCSNACDVTHCPCFNRFRECDMDVCSCSAKCTNNQSNGPKKKLLIAKSEICGGFGLFAGQKFAKDEYICHYIGEKIYYTEEMKRNKTYVKEECTYLFEYDDEYIIDSVRIGNKMRYANHTPKEFVNCNAVIQIITSNKVRKIALVALREIRKYEEILFDYGLTLEFKWLKEYEEKYSYLKINK